MTFDRRLRHLEALLGVEPGDRGQTTPEERAAQAVMEGSAGPEEFWVWIQPVLAVIRAEIVLRSGYFRQVREAGGGPWSWWPMDVAAAIVAVPLAEEHDRALGEHLVRLASLRVRRPDRASSMRPVQRQLVWSTWVSAGVALTALGGPTGRQLRHEAAEGLHDDAIEVIRAAELSLPTAEGLSRRCPVR